MTELRAPCTAAFRSTSNSGVNVVLVDALSSSGVVQSTAGTLPAIPRGPPGLTNIVPIRRDWSFAGHLMTGSWNTGPRRSR
ncbi:hypothetical protein AB0K00_45620 [Dactylosporangium sp. NPDC049525]|uniref:hypothetical protein n=1 Tax=Dactylosporangium sp. NPDC049525 TaxID=3154730 RepID=UPI00343F7AA6